MSDDNEKTHFVCARCKEKYPIIDIGGYCSKAVPKWVTDVESIKYLWLHHDYGPKYGHEILVLLND